MHICTVIKVNCEDALQQDADGAIITEPCKPSAEMEQYSEGYLFAKPPPETGKKKKSTAQTRSSSRSICKCAGVLRFNAAPQWRRKLHGFWCRPMSFILIADANVTAVWRRQMSRVVSICRTQHAREASVDVRTTRQNHGARQLYQRKLAISFCVS